MQGTTGQPQYTITEQDKKQKQQILAAWNAYDGQFAKQLQDMEPSGIDPNANSNRIEPIVNSGVNFAAGKEVKFVVDKAAPKEAQEFLDGVWGTNKKKMALIQDIFTSGGISGLGTLRIIPSQKAVDAIQSGVIDPTAQIFLRVVDPLNLYIQTAPKDCKTPMLFCIEYSTSQTVQGSSNPVQTFYREEIQRIDPDGQSALGMPDDDDTWLMQSWTRIGEKGQWTPDGPSITWPFRFPPIFTCQNRSDPCNFWGRPDATQDLIQQNEDINLNQSNAQVVTTMYADPLITATGVGEAPIDRQIGRIIQLPEGGDIKGVPLQTDLANNLQFTAGLRSNMDEQSGVPSVALGRQSDIPKGNVSGVLMRLLFFPLEAKTEMKWLRYGGMFEDVCEALLQMVGFAPNITVSANFQSALPSDDLASWQVVPLQIQAGVSKRTILTERGYDPDQEEAYSADEAADTNVMFSRGQGFAPPNQQQPNMQQDQPGQDDQQQQGGEQL
jgi:hypothetical protein